ncbi:MAG: RraA family protein [Opitutales bacterium]
MKNPNSDIEAYKREVGMMKLEKLIAEREQISTVEFPIPVKELLSRYEDLYTGAISDVLREHALLDQALPGHLLPLRPECTVAGIAFTVKSAPNVKITGEMTFRTQMISELPADTMVMWDTSNDAKATLWGGVMTATAVGLGVKGAVIDGGIRDTHQILEKDFPVFYKHRSPNGSLGRCLITHYQIPIKIGDVVIKRGNQSKRKRDFRLGGRRKNRK